MRHNITEYDKELLLQTSLNYKYKLVVKNGNVYLDELTGVTNIGDYSIDSESDVRRKTSFTLLLDDIYYGENVEQRISEWFGYDFELQIGIQDMLSDSYKWYPCGTYTITQYNTSYDASTNSISTELSDWFTKLNGERNGQMGGAPTIVIPNQDSSGNKITIKQAAIGVLSETDISDYIVDDIGEFYGMAQYNENYEQYRTLNPNWNQIPYDLEYSCGVNISEILIALRDLYPNCEIYFDVYNNFCFNMIPSCVGDPILLSNDFLQKILLSDNSESVSYDTTSVKNVTEVFGKIYDVDRYAESTSYSSNVYTLTLSDYASYQIGDIIGFRVTAANQASPRIRINSLNSIPLYNEYTTNYVSVGTITPNEIHCVKISYTSEGNVAYYLGQFQPHAICAMVSDINDPVYTKKYFEDKYNCKNVTLWLDADNPFSIQRKGILFQTLSGENFDNIISNSVAESNSVYYNQKSSILNDTVTLTTKMIPWLDVNVKVSYKKQQESEERQYIIKSISNNLEQMTSTITMYRFSPLYFN